MTIDEARNRSDFKKNDIIIDCEFNDSTQFNIANSVILKLKEEGVSRDILIVLYFCLYEAMDNTIQHGKINHGHIIVALGKGKIRILIYDEGVGVYNTFKATCQHETTKQDVIRRALQKKATSGNGKGNGLYAWYLCSKNLNSYFDITTNDIVLVPSLPNYYYLCKHEGTILDLQVPMNTKLSWKKILNDSIFKDIEESYNGIIEGGYND